MGFQKDAMKLQAATTVSQIWERLAELEDLDRQCSEHRPDNQGFYPMTKKVILHQILPESIQHFLLLENKNKDHEIDCDAIKKTNKKALCHI